jgi:hypothetical protein
MDEELLKNSKLIWKEKLQKSFWKKEKEEKMMV